MKKLSATNICRIIELILMISFVIKTIIDGINYTEAQSAPFYVNIIINALMFLVPLMIVFVIELIVRKHKRK